MIHGWSALGGLTMAKWEDELERWLKPFLDRLGHKTRQRMCPLYVAGLIGPGDRKSVQPMAERLATGNYDQLHHFIADGVWDATPLESELLNQANRLVGGKDAVLVIDDTALPKKGDRSVGVAAQYASSRVLGGPAHDASGRHTPGPSPPPVTPGMANSAWVRSLAKLGACHANKRSRSDKCGSLALPGCTSSAAITNALTRSSWMYRSGEGRLARFDGG